MDVNHVIRENLQLSQRPCIPNAQLETTAAKMTSREASGQKNEASVFLGNVVPDLRFGNGETEQSLALLNRNLLFISS